MFCLLRARRCTWVFRVVYDADRLSTVHLAPLSATSHPFVVYGGTHFLERFLYRHQKALL